MLMGRDVGPESAMLERLTDFSRVPLDLSLVGSLEDVPLGYPRKSRMSQT
jgi:hypothetical protein